MKYKVLIMPEAETNISDSFAYIADRSPGNAAKWLIGLYLGPNMELKFDL
jgi:hypothetical protein